LKQTGGSKEQKGETLEIECPEIQRLEIQRLNFGSDAVIVVHYGNVACSNLACICTREFMGQTQRVQQILQGRSQQTWLLLSLIAPLYYGLVSLHHGLAAWRVQDDARLHVVWLQQFWDSELFPHDIMADYYRAIQAWGYQAVYWLLAQMGVEPLILAKLLPTGLAILTTVYLFYLTLALLPAPACGFWTTLLLNQNIWLKDDLISATPRAFAYPLLVMFLYYLVQLSGVQMSEVQVSEVQMSEVQMSGVQASRLEQTGVRQAGLVLLLLIALTGLFYPQLVLVELGLLCLREPRRLWLLVGALGTAVAVILPFRQGVTQAFGALMSAAQMQQMPEFGPGGRRAYFGVDPLSFWFRGASGLRFPLFPPMLWAGLALPWLPNRPDPSFGSAPAFGPTSSFGLARRLLAELLLVSVGLFLLAHLLFPALYLPSRYTFFSLRIAMSLAAGLVLFWAISTIWSAARGPFAQPLLRWLVALFLTAVVVVPALPGLFLPVQGWVTGAYPQLYEFLAAQPKPIRIAAIASEADNLPAFTQRSVLVSRELALPYHSQFYDLMQQRILALLKAQYGSLAELQLVIRQLNIDFWLLDRQFADPAYLAQQDWLIHSSVQTSVQGQIDQLKAGQLSALADPALAEQIAACQVLSEENLILLNATCLLAVQSS
jgi:hypothetical protein